MWRLYSAYREEAVQGDEPGRHGSRHQCTAYLAVSTRCDVRHAWRLRWLTLFPGQCFGNQEHAKILRMVKRGVVKPCELLLVRSAFPSNCGFEVRTSCQSLQLFEPGVASQNLPDSRIRSEPMLLRYKAVIADQIPGLAGRKRYLESDHT